MAYIAKIDCEELACGNCKGLREQFNPYCEYFRQGIYRHTKVGEPDRIHRSKKCKSIFSVKWANNAAE